MNITYPFTEQEADTAYDEWGCNCGPAALAFALQVPLGAVRYSIPGFSEKRYTSPAMMKAALSNLGRRFGVRPSNRDSMFDAVDVCLVRIQWTGPWTAPGANPKWAYRQTHWIATYMVEHQAAMVFDVNGGIRGFTSWQKEIVPLITAHVPRADGGWFPTHVWEVAGSWQP